MNVEGLQTLLRNLAPAVQAAGASSTAARNLIEIADALTPFAGRELGDFRQFLAQAEEFHRTGKVTFPEKGSRRSGRSEPRDLTQLATTLRELQTLLTSDPSRKAEGLLRWTESGIDGLKAPELRALAESLGFTMPATVNQAREMTRQIYRFIFRSTILTPEQAIPRLTEIQSATLGGAPNWNEIEQRFNQIGLERAESDDLFQIATSFGLKPKKNTRPEEVINELRQRLLNRNASEVRRLSQAIRAIEEDAAAPETSREEVLSKIEALNLTGQTEEVLRAVATELGCSFTRNTSMDEVLRKIRNIPLARKETPTLNLV
jgi:hypothetical protein